MEVAGHPDIAGRGGTETDGKESMAAVILETGATVSGTVLLDGLIIIEIHAIWHTAARLDKRLDFLTHEFLGADEPHGIEPPNRKVPFLAFLGTFARFAVGILRLELLVDFKVLVPPGKDRIALATEDTPADTGKGEGAHAARQAAAAIAARGDFVSMPIVMVRVSLARGRRRASRHMPPHKRASWFHS